MAPLTTVTMYAEEAGHEEDSLPALHHDLQWQRNDVRIFAHAAAETQVAIKDALASKFSTSRAGLDAIAQAANDPGFLEVFPRVASRPPKLLQELEAILVDRLRANDKAASTTPLGAARDRDPRLSANLSLDGHRQVFAAFVAGFSTYSPLLSRIQAEFDRALNEGVRSAQENVEMRYTTAHNEAVRERATAEVRGQVLSEDLPFRATSLARLQELRDRAARAEKKKALAEKDLREALAEAARMRALVGQLRETHTKLTELVAGEEKWEQRPLAPSLLPLPIGPLTKADEEYLEQEVGGLDRMPSNSAITPAGPPPPSMFRASSLARSPSLPRPGGGAAGLGSLGAISVVERRGAAASPAPGGASARATAASPSAGTSAGGARPTGLSGGGARGASATSVAPGGGGGGSGGSGSVSGGGAGSGRASASASPVLPAPAAGAAQASEPEADAAGEDSEGEPDGPAPAAPDRPVSAEAPAAAAGAGGGAGPGAEAPAPDGEAEEGPELAAAADAPQAQASEAEAPAGAEAPAEGG